MRTMPLCLIHYHHRYLPTKIVRQAYKDNARVFDKGMDVAQARLAFLPVPKFGMVIGRFAARVL